MSVVDTALIAAECRARIV